MFSCFVSTQQIGPFLYKVWPQRNLEYDTDTELISLGGSVWCFVPDKTLTETTHTKLLLKIINATSVRFAVQK